MPSLIRLLVFLLILAGLAFGAMVGLTAVVDPGEREMRVRIPARDLVMTTESGAPATTLRDQLPAPRVDEPSGNTPSTPPAPSTPPSTSTAPPPDMSTFE